MAVKLRESSIDQILPSWLAEKPEIQALGYAIMKANQKMLDLLEESMVYAGIDRLPEKILDVLAIELRSQYYENDMEISQKRTIVKNTLRLHAKAGTPASVKELISYTFGGGEVTEWFEYGGEPYHFKINTNAGITSDIEQLFSNLIKDVKNIRSHLDAVIIERPIISDIYVGAGTISYTKAPLIIDGYFHVNKAEETM